MGVIEGENIDIPIPSVVEKNTVNSNIDQLVRQENYLVDEPSKLEPTSDFEQNVEADVGEILISLPLILWRILR